MKQIHVIGFVLSIFFAKMGKDNAKNVKKELGYWGGAYFSLISKILLLHYY